jgi:methionyl aminopeptidase
MSSIIVCDTPNCGKPSKLRCPTCVKANIKEGSNFCSQECFTQFWSTHKLVHAKKPAEYNPWPGFKFTGPLRPFPVTPKRLVPAHIPRPDYADHPDGHPLGEMAERGSTNVKVLDDEEIAGMRLACKLAREVLDEAAKAAAVGVTADELDRIVHEAAIERECYPSPLNYYKFPKSVCT